MLKALEVLILMLKALQLLITCSDLEAIDAFTIYQTKGVGHLRNYDVRQNGTTRFSVHQMES